eukprot:c22804_g1_i1 orf=355-999(-)
MRESLPTSGFEMSRNCNVRTPVYLNVYDLTTLNGYLYWMGLGIFHSGIEVYGVEYAFGAHDYSTSGVFEVEPRCCPGFIFRRSIELGATDMDAAALREVIECIAGEYNGDMYHLIGRNCNHFSNDLSIRLTGRSIPGWINRLANIGSFCNCLLPEGLQIAAVHHTPEYHSFEGEEQSDIDNEHEHLLNNPNGEVQSEMVDQNHEKVLEHIENSV